MVFVMVLVMVLVLVMVVVVVMMELDMLCAASRLILMCFQKVGSGLFFAGEHCSIEYTQLLLHNTKTYETRHPGTQRLCTAHGCRDRQQRRRL
jgi:hypothetical protein